MLFPFCAYVVLSTGYNHPELLKVARSDEWIAASVNRPALGVNPPVSWPKLIHDSFMAVAPKGLDNVFAF